MTSVLLMALFVLVLFKVEDVMPRSFQPFIANFVPCKYNNTTD